MTHPTEAAAERLRRVDSGEHINAVYGGSTPEEIEAAPFCVSYLLNLERIDELAILAAYLRETDHTPVDEAFARSVAVDEWSNTAGHHFDIQKGPESAVLLKARDKWLLIILSDARERNCCVDNPTIGQFWSAVRLFNVKP